MHERRNKWTKWKHNNNNTNHQVLEGIEIVWKIPVHEQHHCNIHTHTHTHWVLVSISVVQKDLHETCSLTQHTAYTRHNNEAMHSTHILATCTYSTEHFVSVYAYVYALACVFVYCTILGEGIISWSVSVFVRSLFLSCHSDVSICVAVLLRRKHALCDDLTHSNGTWPANEAATEMKTPYHGNSEVGFGCCVFVAFLFLSYSLILL